MPNRVIRDFTDSMAFDGISAEAERLFWRLLVKADDFGRFHANPRLVKAACFPLAEDLRANTVAAWLTELSDRHLVFCYTSGTGQYLSIRKWRQRMRASVSKYPPPTGQPPDWMPPDDGPAPGIGQTPDGPMTDSCRSTDGQPPDECLTPAPGDGDGDGDVGGDVGGDDILSGSASPPPDESAPTGPDRIPRRTQRMAAARPVLALLNELTGRRFRETEANLLLIAARLDEPGVDLEGVAKMLRRQAALWGPDPRMSEYLRPETLFNRTKFESYYANRDLPLPTPAGGPGVRAHHRNAAISGASDVARSVAEKARRDEDLADSGEVPFGPG